MLAYVFWHTPHPDADLVEYQRRVIAFHRALAELRPAGFQHSLVYHLGSGAPWLHAVRPTYEDWYLVDDSAALDVLNEAAVTGSRENPHDRAASLAAAGTAGLYRLRFGVPQFPRALTAAWITKPPTMPYASFYPEIRTLAGEGAALWGRQMVLGPTPEFCLHPSTAGVPPMKGAVVILADLLWRDGA